MLKPTPLIRSSCQITANLAGSYPLVEHKTFSGNSTTVTGLAGDTDILYRIVGLLIADTDVVPCIRLNGDSGANYSNLNAYLDAAYASDTNTSHDEYEITGEALSAGDSLLFEMTI